MTDKHEDATSIVVFGATGDLAKKKLFPALMDLHADNCLPLHTRIVGVSRGTYTDESFRDFVRELIAAKQHAHKEETIDSFVERIHFICADVLVEDGYQRIAACLKELDGATCSHKLYYLAVSPELYEPIFKNLSASGLGVPCVFEGKTFWVRIAVEKPFGKNLNTAQKLDKELSSLFSEEQIFRIDHYLAKEAVTNILAFRFSNVLFEPIWNKDYVDSVHIRFCEDFGIGLRGAFYDGVGALRDVGQNHVLQMLALTAMEDPGMVSALAIRGAREKVLQALTLPKNAPNNQDATIKGQYASYKSEANVAQDSKTETYFKVTATIDNPRWSGVPFILEGGKMLCEHTIEIRVKFKKVNSCICHLIPENEQPDEYLKNELVIAMHPKEEITIRFWAKKPGFTMDIIPKHFSFSFDEDEFGRKRDAYEKLLLDCLAGDQTLFVTGEEVEHAWRFITPILDAWDSEEPIVYEDGSATIE